MGNPQQCCVPDACILVKIPQVDYGHMGGEDTPPCYEGTVCQGSRTNPVGKGLAREATFHSPDSASPTRRSRLYTGRKNARNPASVEYGFPGRQGSPYIMPEDRCLGITKHSISVVSWIPQTSSLPLRLLPTTSGLHLLQELSRLPLWDVGESEATGLFGACCSLSLRQSIGYRPKRRVPRREERLPQSPSQVRLGDTPRRLRST